MSSTADEADAPFELLEQLRSHLGDSNGRASSLLQRLHSALEGRRGAVDSLRLALQRQTDAQERREAVLADQISNLNAQLRRADREAARAALQQQQQQQSAPAPTSSSSVSAAGDASAQLAEAQAELLRVRKLARADRDEQQRRHEAELDALKRAAAEREQALEQRLAQATQARAPSGKKSGACGHSDVEVSRIFCLHHIVLVISLVTQFCFHGQFDFPRRAPPAPARPTRMPTPTRMQTRRVVTPSTTHRWPRRRPPRTCVRNTTRRLSTFAVSARCALHTLAVHAVLDRFECRILKDSYSRHSCQHHTRF
jgi:hypothetical protein